jgi:hypothetical protein
VQGRIGPVADLAQGLEAEKALSLALACLQALGWHGRGLRIVQASNSVTWVTLSDRWLMFNNLSYVCPKRTRNAACHACNPQHYCLSMRACILHETCSYQCAPGAAGCAACSVLNRHARRLLPVVRNLVGNRDACLMHVLCQLQGASLGKQMTCSQFNCERGICKFRVIP